MREELRASTLRLAEEKGVDGVTVEAVCAATGVAVVTFHATFARVEEALLPDVPFCARRFRESLIVRPPHEAPLHALHGALVRALAGECAADPDERTRVKLVWRSAQLMAQMLCRFQAVEADMAGAVCEWLVVDRDDLRCATLAATAAGALRIAMGRWAEASPGHRLSNSIDEAFGSLRALQRR